MSAIWAVTSAIVWARSWSRAAVRPCSAHRVHTHHHGCLLDHHCCGHCLCHAAWPKRQEEEAEEDSEHKHNQNKTQTQPKQTQTQPKPANNNRNQNETQTQTQPKRNPNTTQTQRRKKRKKKEGRTEEKEENEEEARRKKEEKEEKEEEEKEEGRKKRKKSLLTGSNRRPFAYPSPHQDAPFLRWRAHEGRKGRKGRRRKGRRKEEKEEKPTDGFEPPAFRVPISAPNQSAAVQRKCSSRHRPEGLPRPWTAGAPGSCRS